MGTSLEAPRIPQDGQHPPGERLRSQGLPHAPGGGPVGATVFIELFLETFPIVPNFTQGVVLQNK